MVNSLFNEKTGRCSVRKDGKANDPKCKYNSVTNRCNRNYALAGAVDKPKSASSKFYI